MLGDIVLVGSWIASEIKANVFNLRALFRAGLYGQGRKVQDGLFGAGNSSIPPRGFRATKRRP
jgi:hypothetical protein